MNGFKTDKSDNAVAITEKHKLVTTLQDFWKLKGSSRLWSPEKAGLEIHFPENSTSPGSPINGYLQINAHRCIPCDALVKGPQLLVMPLEVKKLTNENGDSDSGESDSDD